MITITKVLSPRWAFKSKRRMLVWATIEAPSWWWAEMERYSTDMQTGNVRLKMFNYESLSIIYCLQKESKAEEWKMFCDWIEHLPFAELITQPIFSHSDGLLTKEG